MNFQSCPSFLGSRLSPAILVMIVSAILPYAYFKRKGWL